MRAAEADLTACLWTVSRLDDGLEHLLVESGLASPIQLANRRPSRPPAGENLGLWLASRLDGFRIKCDEIAAFYPRLETMLERTFPALVRLESAGGSGYLLVVRSFKGQLRVAAPDRQEYRVPASQVAEMLAAPARAQMPTDVEGWLEGMELPEAARRRARKALFNTCLRTVPIRGVWSFRRAYDAPWTDLLRSDGLPGRLAVFLGLQLLQLAFMLAAWSVVGNGALKDLPPAEWLGTALLGFLSAIPIQLLGSYLAGTIGLNFGVRLKQRLLAGTLNLTDSATRCDGIGGHLSRVLESETFEGAVLSGAILGSGALVQLFTALAILSQGAGGIWHAALLIFWCGLCGLYYRRYFAARSRWGRRRLEFSQRMVERMVGHQTRLAQEDPADWHVREDRELQAYAAEAEAMDRHMVGVQALQSRGWLMAGFAGLIPALLTDTPQIMPIAVALGGILVAQQALGQTLSGLLSIVDAVISWRLIEPLLRPLDENTVTPVAFAQAHEPGSQSADPGVAAADERAVILEAMDLGFRYSPQSRPVLHACSCMVRRNARIVLQGASGSGKSTLARLLAGLERPQEGLMLYRGLDRESLGRHWNRVVTLSPQFHRNHIFSASLSFNVLMGSEWPAQEREEQEAEALCRALGLGELIDRMPNGMHQIVGETGWQLSHGETTRVQLARALLQKTQLVILDENFAALDPQTLELCLQAMDRHDRAYVVIAHF